MSIPYRAWFSRRCDITDRSKPACSKTPISPRNIGIRKSCAVSRSKALENSAAILIRVVYVFYEQLGALHSLNGDHISSEKALIPL